MLHISPPPPPPSLSQGMGFLCLVISIVDILLAFLQLSQLDSDSAQFSMEVKQSRFTIQAVKSGQSIPLVC